MTHGIPVLGVDIGSVSASCVLADPHGGIIASRYAFHKGDPLGTLRRLFSLLPLPGEGYLACTTSTPEILPAAHRCDSHVAVITSARYRHPELRTLLLVGGERFSLIAFDEAGEYRSFKANTSCAAGTGSFLDQQARRLGLAGSAELSDLALGNTESLPRIASRCSVFAKTDIIHAQAEGHGLHAICDGLCEGLARTIWDTLAKEKCLVAPILFAGGVSLNKAVRRHLESCLELAFVDDPISHLYGAYGACLDLLARVGEQAASGRNRAARPVDFSSCLVAPTAARSYHFEPITEPSGNSSVTGDTRSYLFEAASGKQSEAVEVEVYQPCHETPTDVHLGIDVGSTSTKAALVAAGGIVVASFYTRTGGQPIRAVQSLFRAIIDAATRGYLSVEVIGAATTGSGRKFVGAIIGADLVLDEISAHARAAYELDPSIDTIIEIGGQDSKFTTMQNGMVTFSRMNTVCAAGTGSFLEEQAQRLGVPLSEYAERAMGKRAPIASDRCTVFMERDINNYLHKGYSVDEILAAALFSVSENYLLKVARSGRIGKAVAFQGATARNRGLVSVFERKLGRELFVSRYCHITGAIGAALTLAEQGVESSAFRGLALHGWQIPIRTETCTICRNRCRILVADVNGSQVAYGFLCGRDYSNPKKVSRVRPGYDLLALRRQAVRRASGESDGNGSGVLSGTNGRGSDSKAGNSPRPQGAGELGTGRAAVARVVGIPASLHLHEDVGFWRSFFAELEIPTVTSERCEDAHAKGKHIAGAEFCAPIAAFHGHCAYLAEKADVVFAPVYLEGRRERLDAPLRKEKQLPTRKLCYYSQFAPSLVSGLGGAGNRAEFCTPLFDPRLGLRGLYAELQRSLAACGFPDLSIRSIREAYRGAAEQQRTQLTELRREFSKAPHGGEPEVVLLGRPYTVLDDAMNKRIPELVASHGVRVWYQDMLPGPAEIDEDTEALLSAFHWSYASRIIEAASTCAATPGLYPILITSFKCAPDSFLIEYFGRIMEKRGKPYIMLQLDEHDSAVGYETRIEAGLRSFRNHHALESGAGSSVRTGVKLRELSVGTPVLPALTRSLDGKTVLYPNWDPISCRLTVANLRRHGIDARLLEEDTNLIQESMKNNSGQCIPVHIILEEFAHYVRKHDLDPSRCVLWMLECDWACNIRLYPYYMRTMLGSYGDGMEKAGVYMGSVFHLEYPLIVSLRGYFGYFAGGLLRRLGCRIRPYELHPGETDSVTEASTALLEKAFLGELGFEEALDSVVSAFEQIPYRDGNLPKVAIFGDIYVRDNDVMNQQLIHCIEDAGGEVVATPYNQYLKIVAGAHFRKLIRYGEYRELAFYRSMLRVVNFLERRFSRRWDDVLPSSDGEYARSKEEVEGDLARFHLHVAHEGESFENVLKVLHLARSHPDLALFVQTNPAFCCPSIVTEAMSGEIERITGVPVVTITYDGTSAPKNDLIVPYLRFPRSRAGVLPV